MTSLSTITHNVTDSVKNAVNTTIHFIGNLVGRPVTYIRELPIHMQESKTVAAATVLTANAAFFTITYKVTEYVNKRILLDSPDLNVDQEWAKNRLLDFMMGATVLTSNILFSRVTGYYLSNLTLVALTAGSVVLRNIFHKDAAIVSPIVIEENLQATHEQEEAKRQRIALEAQAKVAEEEEKIKAAQEKNALRQQEINREASLKLEAEERLAQEQIRAAKENLARQAKKTADDLEVKKNEATLTSLHEQEQEQELAKQAEEQEKAEALRLASEMSEIEKARKLEEQRLKALAQAAKEEVKQEGKLELVAVDTLAHQLKKTIKEDIVI